MTEHLPECELHGNGCAHDYYNDPPLQCANCGESCICPALRACEQRMREEHRHRCSGCDWCYSDGVREALNAAREAVRNECFHDTESEWCVFVAAIDALREKP